MSVKCSLKKPDILNEKKIRNVDIIFDILGSLIQACFDEYFESHIKKNIFLQLIFEQKYTPIYIFDPCPKNSNMNR